MFLLKLQRVTGIFLLAIIGVFLISCSDGEGLLSSKTNLDVTSSPLLNPNATIKDGKVLITWEENQDVDYYIISRKSTNGYEILEKEYKIKSEYTDTPTWNDTFSYSITALQGEKTTTASTNEVKFIADQTPTTPSELAITAFENKTRILQYKPIVERSYFVSKDSGDDRNTGTPQQPLKTISYAIKNAQKNSKLFILVAVTKSDGYDERMEPIENINNLHLIGGYSSDFSGLTGKTKLLIDEHINIVISQCENITIDGFYIKQKGMVISSSRTLQITNSKDVILSNSYIESPHMKQALGGSLRHSVAIYAEENENISILNNIILGLDDPINSSMTSIGLWLGNNISPNLIANNIIVSAEKPNSEAIRIYDYRKPPNGELGVSIINNIITSNNTDGTDISLTESTKVDELSNNLFLNASSSVKIGYIMNNECKSEKVTTQTQLDNLFTILSKWLIAVSPTKDLYSNNIQTNAKWNDIFQTSNITVDSRLNSKSPAIKKGKTIKNISRQIIQTILSKDIDDEPRPSSEGWDIGPDQRN
ncbi:MAG: hypothetical protein ABIE74_07520 [Pseudomonadota bacterium]